MSADPIIDMAIEAARAQARAVAEGVKIGAREAQAKLDAIFAAYDKAMLDAAVRLPIYLHAAIERARDFPNLRQQQEADEQATRAAHSYTEDR